MPIATVMDPTAAIEAGLTIIDHAIAAGFLEIDDAGALVLPPEAEVVGELEQLRQQRREERGSSDTADQERVVVGGCLLGGMDHRERWGEFRGLLGLTYSDPVPAGLWSDPVAREVATEIDATYRNRREVRLINGSALIESLRARIETGIERSLGLQEFAAHVRELESDARGFFAATDFRIAAEILRSKLGRNKLREVAQTLIADGVKKEVDIAEVTARAMQGIEEATSILSGRMGTAHAFASVADLWFQVEGVMAQERCAPIPTGITALDVDIQGGVKPNDTGKMHLIGARTGVGKTTLAIAAAAGLVRNGAHVLFLSCELNQKEIGARFLANYARSRQRPDGGDRDLAERMATSSRMLPQWRLEGRGHLPFEGSLVQAYGDVMTAWQEDQQMGVVGDFSCRAQFLADAETFVEMIRSAKAQNPGLSAVFLDHFHAMRPSKGSPRDRSQEMEVRAQTLHGIAKECEIDLFLLCQLNREAAIAPDGPAKEHINGTDSLAQLASAVWLLEYGKTLGPEGKMITDRTLLDLHHGKSRNGQYLGEQSIQVAKSSLCMDRDHCIVAADDTARQGVN